MLNEAPRVVKEDILIRFVILSISRNKVILNIIHRMYTFLSFPCQIALVCKQQ